MAGITIGGEEEMRRDDSLYREIQQIMSGVFGEEHIGYPVKNLMKILLQTVATLLNQKEKAQIWVNLLPMQRGDECGLYLSCKISDYTSS